ncbi:MucB/RseB C-terminal domain-containing protein [Trinickia sp. Y13]|uniref:MucB/RseB C-terminal domain-containing protein n=1 Tax=Trinickia sp. Y13 TaxID=2917807 RepID=UPI002405D873|nr:MucB/RseB C-terminal domain-containing protein [Trinickia sp. Y13]MDG0027090.1 MucB/RseB C-terminal domain-containing protein [Trinickia sp. Y13]
MQTLRSMRAAARGQWAAWLICAVALLSASPRAAVAQADPSVRQQAAAWLDRIHEAAQRENYEGVFVYQRGNFVQSSRIAHYAVRGEGEFESLESLDGQPRKLLRHDDDLYTFVPERHLCVVEKRLNRDAFPALMSEKGEQVLSVYDPKLLSGDRVAGLDAQVIELDPKDTYRFAYKLWADAKTGLLLRVQTLDASGQVLEQTAFTQVRVGVPTQKSSIAAGMRNTNGWTLVRPPVSPIDMQAQGWRIKPDVPGFHEIRELRRPMAAREAGAPPIPVDQAVFSDGLSTISVFVEPAEKSSRKEGVGSTGATHVLVTKYRDYWVTVLGEVPQATLQRFASAIEYKVTK